jgi:hypothetical protein
MMMMTKLLLGPAQLRSRRSRVFAKRRRRRRTSTSMTEGEAEAADSSLPDYDDTVRGGPQQHGNDITVND